MDRLFRLLRDPVGPQKPGLWIRRRLRCAFWQQWKTIRKRYAELVKRGVRPELAKSMAGSNNGPWHLSLSQATSIAVPNAPLASLGLFSLAAGQKPN